MNHKYAPDMDAEDAFGISQTQIDRILELFDEGPESLHRVDCPTVRQPACSALHL